MNAKRSAGVIVLIVLALLEGLLLLALAAALFAARHDPVLADADLTEGKVLALAIVVGILGLLNVGFGVGLIRRVEAVRFAFAAVATLEAGIAVYGLIALRDLRAGSVWAFAFPAVILWLLYGSRRTRAYFAS